MKASDDLFQLIKSMSKSEKGYFKKYVSKHTIGEQNIYVRLFDAIDNLDNYDETEIKNSFKGEKFADKLYSTKNYLFNLILKALSSYHSEKYSVSKLNNILIELNVLFDKGLYKHYKTLLNKAIDIATENDRIHYLAHLYDKEIKLTVTEYYEGHSMEEFIELKNKIIKNLDNMRIEEQYQLLYYELFYLLKKMGSVRSAKDLETLNSFVNNPLLKHESLAESFNSKFHLYSVLGHYYRIINDANNWYKYRKLLFQLMDGNPKYIKEYPTSYISAINNFLNACVNIGKYSEFEKTLVKFKEFSKRYENKKEYLDNQTRIFLLISDLELTYAIKSLKPENLKNIIEEIEKGFSKYGSKIGENRKISLYNRIAFACFIIKDYDKSILYISRIMNATNPKIEPEQHSFARIRSLIVHFEAGNYDLVDHAVKSARRYLQKANRIYKFEKLILGFIVKALNYTNDYERIALYEKLKHDIEKISGDKFEKNALEQFDVISWINSKIEHTGMITVLKKKAV